MSPEHAREMLDRVKEGCPLPWEIHTTETLECDPREVKSVRYSDPDYDGHLAYSMDYDGTTEIDPDAIELIAAAPELAEIVANLRYEYAVQVEDVDGGWRTLGDAWTSRQVARDRYEATPGKKTGRVRIVRHLATTPEVVE